MHDHYVSDVLPAFFRLRLTVREFLGADIVTEGTSRLAGWISDRLHHSRGAALITDPSIPGNEHGKLMWSSKYKESHFIHTSSV